LTSTGSGEGEEYVVEGWLAYRDRHRIGCPVIQRADHRGQRA
jgi:hypothetical protein